MTHTKYLVSRKEVYLFLYHRKNTQLYRFGITRQNPEDKIKQFNVERNGIESFMLRYYIEIPRDKAFEAKKLFKALYKDNHIKGEIFLFTKDLVSGVVNTMNTYESENLPQEIKPKKKKFNSVAFILFIILLLVSILIVVYLVSR